MANPIWALVEHDGSKISAPGLESLGLARQLAGQLSTQAIAVVLGKGVASIAEAAAGYGVAKVLCADGDGLAPYTTHGWLGVLARLMKDSAPSVVVVSHGPIGRDLASRLAARTGAAVATDCTKVTAEGGKLCLDRPIYAGKLVASCEADLGAPVVVTVRPKSYDKAVAGGDKAPVENVGGGFEEPAIAALVKEVVAASGGRAPLTEADIVVAAGRGIKGPEGFGIIEELADVLGASVGASRAVVDAGWREHSAQVGQTGVVVAPKLYLAIGISGAIQHLVGMQNSQYILAVNKDADAPIFQKADFGIVGDLFEVVPALTAAFKEALGK